jgi:hypothetical protein
MITGRKHNDPFDFYTTPPDATISLLRWVNFFGSIWEPASGSGGISHVLEHAFGADRVISSDLREHEIWGQGGVDFLKTSRQVDNVITNPPFNKALDFVRHGIKVARKKAAFLLRLNFLESKSRYPFLNEHPPWWVLLFSQRIDMSKGQKAAKMVFAWFIWDNQFKRPAWATYIPVNLIAPYNPERRITVFMQDPHEYIKRGVKGEA